MARSRKSVLPEPLHALLVRVAAACERGGVVQHDLGEAIASLGKLDGGKVVRVDAEMSKIFSTWRPSGPVDWKIHAARRDRTGARLRLLAETPRLDFLFLFHPDGFVREAALAKIAGALPSPFYFCAIVWRLNDWVENIRHAATKCAQRAFPATAAPVIAEAHLELVTRLARWRRWQRSGGEIPTIVTAQFARSDVIVSLVESLKGTSSGGASSALRALLQTPAIDQHLIELTHARHPQIRSLAIRALVTGRATWRTGYAWRWIDKVYGVGRWVAVVETRAIEHDHPIGLLIAQGARDKSPIVRRAAADGLIEHWRTLPDLERLLSLFDNDAAPAIRERVDYIRRHMNERR